MGKIMSSARALASTAPPSVLFMEAETQCEDYTSLVQSYLILWEWHIILWWIRLTEDQVVYIGYEQVIYTVPYDGQAACWRPS